jgi:hypothetical protein
MFGQKEKNKERSQKVSGKFACLVGLVQAWDGKNKYLKAPKVVLFLNLDPFIPVSKLI